MVGILRGLFKREPKVCERCSTSVERLHVLDGTWRGEFKAERKQQLCSQCLRDGLELGFSSISNRCVLAQPVVKSNAYYAYRDSDEDLKVALGTKGVSQGDLNNTRQAISALINRVGASCDHCENQSPNFLWLSGDTFDYKWWSFDIRDIAKSHPKFSSLCASCSATSGTEAVETIGLRWDEVWAPRDGTVLMFSGES